MLRLKKTDRRKFPRIDHRLPINVVANGYDLVSSTKNISCIGTYCHLDKYIPPFTKIAIKVNLPIVTKDGIQNSNVECKGVVVRSEDDTSGGFNIAIFFNGITEMQRKKISQYINQLLP